MADSENTVGRTGIHACGESVSRRNSLESVALFSLKQEAPRLYRREYVHTGEENVRRGETRSRMPGMG